MGAEQADGLVVNNPENKPNLTEILSSTDEQTINEVNKKPIQNVTQYYYERKEINTSSQKIENKESTKEEPDSTTIIGNRVIQMGKPTTIYEKRVISKTIKREGNIINNTNNTNNITKTTQTKIIKTVEKDNVNINENNDENIDLNKNKINNINNSIQKKNIISYNNPSAKIMHKNIAQNKNNIKQKNILPKTSINVNKSSNYFNPSINTNNNNNNKMINNINNIHLNPIRSCENINIPSSTPNKLLASTNNTISTKIHLKKIEMPNNLESQRSHSPDINSIKRKTINRGDQIKNIQITHIICSNKNKNPDFHITEKLATNNIKSTPISVQDREKLKNKGKSTYTSSCTEPKIINTQNLKGKTTIYQHARGIGMTNDRRNSNSNFYTSDIKKMQPIEPIMMKKEKVEHIENFRSSKFRNNNTIDMCSGSRLNRKIGNKNNKEKIFVVKDGNDENKNGNIIA